MAQIALMTMNVNGRESPLDMSMIPLSSTTKPDLIVLSLQELRTDIHRFLCPPADIQHHLTRLLPFRNTDKVLDFLALMWYQWHMKSEEWLKCVLQMLVPLCWQERCLKWVMMVCFPIWMSKLETEKRMDAWTQALLQTTSAAKTESIRTRVSAKRASSSQSSNLQKPTEPGLSTGYKPIVRLYLGGTAMIVLARQPQSNQEASYQWQVKETTSVATGWWGWLVNKGAVSAVLQKHDISIRLIAAHLSAHEDQVSARNKDFGLIERSCRIDATVTFFLGDLNYRLMRKPSSTKVEDWLVVDELTIERKAGNAFSNYSEPPIQFPPT
jgi:hypothetical protein